jgi:hypothetical protein
MNLLSSLGGGGKYYDQVKEECFGWIKKAYGTKVVLPAAPGIVSRFPSAAGLKQWNSEILASLSRWISDLL